MFYLGVMTKLGGTILPNLATPGRAAGSNHAGRFEPYGREVVHDGWDIPEDPTVARTEVSEEAITKVISANASPDVPFDRSINPYRGCEHGCIYCFARPSHAYLGLSPGLDFETKLVARPGAAQALRRELSASGYQPKMIAIGTNTDPYQPIELRYGIMRQVLEVLRDFQHPVSIVTKGTLVERDLDILGEMGQAGLAQVAVSVTTLDVKTARIMEPRVPAPARRLAIIEKLARAGCPVRVMLAPVVPGLTDHEVEAILSAAADAGARGASWTMLRLPREVSPLFKEWLARHYPDRMGKIMARVREMHGGQDYDAQWGRRMRGSGPYAALIARRFEVAVQRLGLARPVPKLRCDLFQVPGRAQQLPLF
ncbi:MAG: PA0069 family radical SAM protein [Paracoccaceae bacterium]